MYSVLNTLLEYTYIYISKNNPSYTFLLVKSSKAFNLSLIKNTRTDNFKQISHIVLVFPLLTLNKQLLVPLVSLLLRVTEKPFGRSHRFQQLNPSMPGGNKKVTHT